jgi:hypothetical protein
MENDSDNNDGGIVVPMPEMKALAGRIRMAMERTSHGHEEWVAGSIELASVLVEARAKFQNDDVQFGHWLVDERLEMDPHERAALVKIGQHIEKAEPILVETEFTKYRNIWEREIKPSMDSESRGERKFTIVPKSTVEPGETVNQDSESAVSGHERRSPLRGRIRVTVPGSEDVVGLFRNKDSRVQINRILSSRGGKDLIALMREVRDAGFLQEHNASIKSPSLRLLFPDARVGYANKFDLLKSADRKSVRDQILPAALAHRERLLTSPEAIEQVVNEYWKSRREADQAARREALLTQKFGQMAEGERETVMFGERLWPRIDDRRGIYDYNQLRSAIYTFRDVQSLMALANQSPGSTRIYAKQLMRWLDNYINLFCKAPDRSTPTEVAGIRTITRLVGALGDLFAANPDGECRYAPSPHVEGEW